jgi:hypothetical protein
MPNFDFLREADGEGDEEPIRINTASSRRRPAARPSTPPLGQQLQDVGKGLMGCGCLVFIGFLVFAGVAGQGMRKPWNKEDHSAAALLMAQKLVTANLVAPASAKFPGAVWDNAIGHVRRNGQTYRIDSYVDSQNAFGAMLRTRYSVTLTRTGPEYEDFRLDDIKIMEQ